jgi:DNA-binding NtrC family response regulator
MSGGIMSKIRILFVDDEIHNCKLFKRYFAKSEDVDVITTTSAEEAKKLLDDPGFIDILVSDQRMPNTKGHMLLSYCQETYPKIYRVLTTANLEEVEALLTDNEMVEIIQEFLSKPWSSSEIKKLVSNIT